MAAQSTYSLVYAGTGTDVIYSPFNSILNGATAYSFSFWLKASSTQNAGFPRLFEIDDLGDTAVFLNGSATALLWRLLGVDLTGAPTADNWHNIAGRWDGSRAWLYVDGAQVDTQLVSGSISDSSQRISIGGSINVANRSVTGSMDDAAMWTSDIGATNIAGIAGTPGVAGSSSVDIGTLSPVLLWRAEAGSGTTLADTSGNGNDGTFNGGVTWSALNDVPLPLQAGAGATNQVWLWKA